MAEFKKLHYTTEQVDEAVKIALETIPVLEYKVEGKADQTDLAALSETVDGKASQAALAIVDAKVNTKESIVDAEATRTRVGNVEIGVNNLTEEVAAKASIEEVETLKVRVDNKADTTTVNALTSDVRAAEVRISGAEANIKLKADSTRVDEVSLEVSKKASQADLTALDAEVRKKATKEALSALSTVVDGKASQSALDTLSEVVDGKEDTVKVDLIRTDVATAQQDIDGLKGDITQKATKKQVEELSGEVANKATKLEVQAVDSRVGDAEVRISGAEAAITQKASLESVSKLDAKIDTQIGEVKDDLAKKAEQEALKAVETKVDGKASKEALAEVKTLVDSKANLTELEATNTRVTSAETRIDGAEAAIESKASAETVSKLSAKVDTKADETKVTGIDTRVTAAELELDGLDGRFAIKATETAVSELSTTVTNKADKSTVETIKTDMVKMNEEIEAHSGQIALAATKSELSTVETKVNGATADIVDIKEVNRLARIDIDANTSAITTKASTETVNKIDGRVTTAEGQLVVQAGQISSKVAQDEYDTKTGELSSQISTVKQTADGVSAEVVGARGGKASLVENLNRIEASIQSGSGNAIYKQKTEPTEKIKTGDMWFCTEASASYTANKWYRYNGATWEQLTDGEIVTATENISSLAVTTQGIQTNVSTLQTNVTNLGTTVSGHSSSIEQNANKIGLVVEEKSGSNVIKAASIVTAINGTGSEVKIAADKITLDGNVVMKSDLTDGTTTISGGNIKTGTISADRIDADNLKVKAANITGTLTIGQLSSDVAQKTDIKTKTSELTNDSGFQNATQVTTITNDTISTTSVEAANLKVKAANITGTLVIGQLPDTVAETSDIPTKTSELTNDSGYKNETEVNSIVEGKGYQTATQVTTITKDTISTTNVEAANLKVKAANITGTLTIGTQVPNDLSQYDNSKTGYQNKSAVDTNITGRGYQTSSDVESAITSKGYQTEAGVTTIVEGTVTTDYVDALGITAKKIEVTDTASKLLFKADGLATTPTVNIGGFTVNDKALYNGTATSASYLNKGVYTGTDGILVVGDSTTEGESTICNYVKLDPATGKITANKGDIAGFKFGEGHTSGGTTYSGKDRFYKPNTSGKYDGIGLYNGSGWMVDDNGNGVESGGHSVMLYAGANEDPRNGKFKITKDGWLFMGGITSTSCTSYFKVDPDGKLFAKGAAINGDLGANSIIVSDDTNTTTIGPKSVSTTDIDASSNINSNTLNTNTLTVGSNLVIGNATITPVTTYTTVIYNYTVEYVSKVSGTENDYSFKVVCRKSGSWEGSPFATFTKQLVLDIENTYGEVVGFLPVDVEIINGQMYSDKTVTVSEGHVLASNQSKAAFKKYKVEPNGTPTSISVNKHFLPSACAQYDLGSSGTKWNKGYFYGGVAQNPAPENANSKRLTGPYSCTFDKLEPVMYKEADNEAYRVGFTVDNIKTALSESGICEDQFAGLVKDHDEKTNTDNYSINYSEFIGILVKEVQDLKKEVKVLRAEVNELKNK